MSTCECFFDLLLTRWLLCLQNPLQTTSPAPTEARQRKEEEKQNSSQWGQKHSILSKLTDLNDMHTLIYGYVHPAALAFTVQLTLLQFPKVLSQGTISLHFGTASLHVEQASKVRMDIQ